MLILDTSAVIEVFKETQKGKEILKVIGSDELSITTFTVHELLVGIRESEVLKIQGFLTSVKIFSFDPPSAVQSAKVERQLSSKGKKIEESDVLIAGICIANNSKLITLDKGFSGISLLDAIIIK